MNRMSSFVPACFLIFGLWLASMASHAADGESAGIGNGVSIGYKFDRQTAAHRTGIAAVDSTGATSVAANVTEFRLLGRPNVPVSGRFSAAGADAKVRLYAFWEGSDGTETLLGVSNEVTLTASAVQDGSSYYIAPTYVFDGFGANVVRIVVTDAPSDGLLNLWVGSY